MFTRFSLFLLIILGISLESSGVSDQVYNFAIAEDSLSSILKRIVKEESFSQKKMLNDDFESFLREVLSHDGSFNYPFDSLQNIGKLKSKDELLRVFTWNLPLSGGYHKYFGFIQVKHNDAVKLYSLSDNRNNITDPQNEILSPSNWFGALYYHIETNSASEKNYYTLLGYDFNNLFTSKRVIEVVSIDNNGNPVFGAPIFSVRNRAIYRVIFEHSARAKMILRYDENIKMIIFDHLSPSRNDLAGNYQFYGPDFTYDGFKFEDGLWKFYSNIDLRNPPRDNLPKPLTPPVENPEPGFLYRSNKELTKEVEK